MENGVESHCTDRWNPAEELKHPGTIVSSKQESRNVCPLPPSTVPPSTFFNIIAVICIVFYNKTITVQLQDAY